MQLPTVGTKVVLAAPAGVAPAHQKELQQYQYLRDLRDEALTTNCVTQNTRKATATAALLLQEHSVLPSPGHIYMEAAFCTTQNRAVAGAPSKRITRCA
jgi:hypothetical protein